MTHFVCLIAKTKKKNCNFYLDNFTYKKIYTIKHLNLNARLL